MEQPFTIPDVRCLAGLYLVLFTCGGSGPAVDSMHWALCLAIPLICLQRLLRVYPGLRSVGLWLLYGTGGTAILIVAWLPILLAGAPAAVVAAIAVLLYMSVLVLTDLSLIGYCIGIVPANFLMPTVLSLALVSFASASHLVVSTTKDPTYALAVNFAVALSLVILIKAIGRLEMGPVWNPGIGGRDAAADLDRLLLIHAELVMAIQTAGGVFASRGNPSLSFVERRMTLD